MSVRLLPLFLMHTEIVPVQQVSMDLNDFLCLGWPSYVNSSCVVALQISVWFRLFVARLEKERLRCLRTYFNFSPTELGNLRTFQNISMWSFQHL